MNLVEALLKANEEAREHLRQLDEIDATQGPSAGIAISRSITKGLIAQTEAAIGSGDVLAMLRMATAHGIGEPERTADAAPGGGA